MYEIVSMCNGFKIGMVAISCCARTCSICLELISVANNVYESLSFYDDKRIILYMSLGTAQTKR